jgi:hypothetical protein
MTLFWIEEGFVTEDQFDRLTGMPKPGAVVHILSTPRHWGSLFESYLKKGFENLKGERMPDNWKHRSEGMRCKTCMFFVPKVPANDCIVAEEKACLGPGRMMTASEFLKPPYDLGRCRRHAPTMSGWPVMFVNDWCGDHKTDENKL